MNEFILLGAPLLEGGWLAALTWGLLEYQPFQKAMAVVGVAYTPASLWSMQPFLGSVCASSYRLPDLQPGPHPLRLAALEPAVTRLGILSTWHDRGGVALVGWRTLG